MKMTPSTTAGTAVATLTKSVEHDKIDPQPRRSRPLMRKFEVSYLNAAREIDDMSRLAPALPAFEDAFAALGRGAILKTDFGQCAVEDLLPGDEVMTSTNGLQTLLWKGSMTIVPGSQNMRAHMGTMTRVTSDAFGMGRPAPDLVLGPSARLFHRAHGVRELTGADAALVPVRDFIDQNQIIELTPVTAVQVYQLGFENHERVAVNGIEIETLHPGPVHALGLHAEMQQLLLSLFPHKQALSDFGPTSHPRLNLRDLDIFDRS